MEFYNEILSVDGRALRVRSRRTRHRPRNGYGRAEGDCASDNRGVWPFVSDRLQRFRRMLALCPALRLSSGCATYGSSVRLELERRPEVRLEGTPGPGILAERRVADLLKESLSRRPAVGATRRPFCLF